jgi:hypothetical protein
VVGAFAVAALLAVSTSARAAASARLVYVRGPGAEQCPGEAAVRAAVSVRLGYDPFFAWARDTLFAEITRADGTFHVELKLVDDGNMLRGARQIAIAGTDCSAVIEAAGLTISLTIDPASVMTAPAAPAAQPPPSPVPSSPPVPETLQEPAPVVPPAPEEVGPLPARPHGETLQGHIGLGAVGSLGAAPSATMGATLMAGVSWRSVSLDAEGRADLPATGAAEGVPASVRSWLVAGSLVPCVHFGIPFGCVLVSGGSLSATSVNVAAPRDDHAPWWGTGLRAGGELALPYSLSLRAYAELLATLTRNTLVIDQTVAYTYPTWSGGVGAALLWRFP